MTDDRALRRGAMCSPVKDIGEPANQDSNGGTAPVVYEGAVGGGE